MKKDKTIRRNTGLPMDDLEKVLEEFRKRAREEIAELERQQKELKIQKRKKRKEKMKKFFKVMFWVCFFPIAICVYVLRLLGTDKKR